jgi:hypothetical protein
VVVNAEPTKANKTTPASERQSPLKNDLTGPTLLEMSGKPDFLSAALIAANSGLQAILSEEHLNAARNSSRQRRRM